MGTIDTVHVVFKTHLDIGFTDLAENVTKQYIEEFIPKAIELTETLSKEEGEASFLWTTGSWLIWEYLKTADDVQKKKMENVIKDGNITWHGLPFTTHTELMDSKLFEFGLSVADKLDKRFNKKTIAAKMTDVPGHTIAMVPYMAKQGIKYLHLGVNPTSKNPDVPNIFVWKAKDGSELIVNYASNYGEVLKIEGLSDALVFAHTGDNCGPPSEEEIKEEFANIRKRFPNANIKASTLDNFAEKLLAVKDKLPVLYEEIGDTWIHGVGTDPKKVSHYRELLRLRDRWLEEGRMSIDSEEYIEFSMKLALLTEHTWGLDLKKYLIDYKNYSDKDFKKARELDVIPKEAITEKYEYIGAFAMNEFDFASSKLFSKDQSQITYSLFESSWKEQRQYIDQAVETLNEDKQKEVQLAFEQLKCQWQDCDTGTQIRVKKEYKLGKFIVSFGQDGAIVSLKDEKGKQWSDDKHSIGAFRYEAFGQENYNHWFENYMENLSKTHNWADSDFSKPGMEYADPKPAHYLYEPNITMLKMVKQADYDKVVAQLEMPDFCTKELGAPKKVVIEYKFYENEEKIDIELYWFNKNACRLPEATWFSVSPKVDNHNLWKMEKMGELISPLEVVRDGNRNLHAVDKGLYYCGADGRVAIETLDAPLVSPGEKRILRFDNTFATLDNGMHFNLNNNIWGTNFPMWYEDDAKFRFTLSLNSY